MKPLEKLLKKPGSHLPVRPAAPPGQVPGPGSVQAPRRQSLSRPPASPEEPAGPAGPVPGGEGRWLELRPPEAPLRSPEDPSPGCDRDRDRDRDREPPSPEPPPAARCCCGCGCAPAAPAPPERLLAALLDRLPAAAHGRGCGAESLLDDIVLTHSLFLPTERFLQQLHQHFVLAAGSPPARWEEGSGLRRKRAVLAVLLHFLETYKGLLQEEESAGKVIKELYLLIMKDTSLYHELEDEIIKLHQLVETVELKVADETPPPNKQVNPGTDPSLCPPAEKAVLQPSEECVFTTLGINSHLFACTRDTLDSLVPLPEEIQVVPGDTEIHRAEPEDVANHLTAFHWELFRCIHELEFVDYVFHGERGRRETANLELLLQRCSEVQHWVGTELLLCEGLGKRAHLLKKLIKIAAICKQNQDMLSFYAIVIGLNNAAVSRLRLTWEKLPGKFKNLFRKFENLTVGERCGGCLFPVPCPFPGLELEASPAQLQTKAYVRQLRVIDNQNLLFELSYKLEPGSQ
ncbi:rap guanine nucleotide exchange factor-like 1 [Onychostruthus taczanowskii]|uniref:rap guanine nucleotide exchange factor-like 1 n=1 Tax=Onychostruthus taczanowskii TaxID=356909 RepID=UPI001B80C3F9|nr:rap guanine nucleotide exchange factor-like 1 [Onychostruthus taczanowskii]